MFVDVERIRLLREIVRAYRATCLRLLIVQPIQKQNHNQLFLLLRCQKPTFHSLILFVSPRALNQAFRSARRTIRTILRAFLFPPGPTSIQFPDVNTLPRAPQPPELNEVVYPELRESLPISP